ncbi:hypothetical protein [Gracilibacillus xinjiangensis]|uniref:Uncharacterized protein n=1 Tax=Gracilibacillus xinjiangensis TaxID=1193282 RepID=A0ABV8WTI6_9BACI
MVYKTNKWNNDHPVKTASRKVSLGLVIHSIESLSSKAVTWHIEDDRSWKANNPDKFS